MRKKTREQWIKTLGLAFQDIDFEISLCAMQYVHGLNGNGRAVIKQEQDEIYQDMATGTGTLYPRQLNKRSVQNDL